MGDNHYTKATDAITDSFDALEKGFAPESIQYHIIRAYRDMALTAFAVSYERAKQKAGLV